MSDCSYVLSCESTADYPRAFFEQRDIAWVPFHYTIDGVSHPDDLYTSITPEAFFNQIKAGAQPTTSQVGVGEYEGYPAPHALVGHIGFVQLRLHRRRAAARALSRAPRVRGGLACRVGGLRSSDGVPRRPARRRHVV